MDTSYVRLLSPSKRLAEWWQEVKENYQDGFWKDTDKFFNSLLKTLIEVTMEEEVIVYTGAEWHKKSCQRIDCRNGYRYRDFLTKHGWIDDIKVPRLRKTKFRTKVFKNYQRRQQAVDQALRDVFLAGVSTRRVGEALSCLLGQDYLINPQVSIFVKEYAKISILGQVRNPGSYEMRGNLALTQAIALAGGFTEVANMSKVKIIRISGEKKIPLM